jgi:hypothetical protein
MPSKHKISQGAAEMLYPAVLDSPDDRRAVIEAGVDFYFSIGGAKRADEFRVKEWVKTALSIWNRNPHLRCGLSKEELLHKMDEMPCHERENLPSTGR